MVSEPQEIMRRWEEYIEWLYAADSRPSEEDLGIEEEDKVADDDKGNAVQTSEIEASMKEMKNGKRLAVLCCVCTAARRARNRSAPTPLAGEPNASLAPAPRWWGNASLCRGGGRWRAGERPSFPANLLSVPRGTRPGEEACCVCSLSVSRPDTAAVLRDLYWPSSSDRSPRVCSATTLRRGKLCVSCVWPLHDDIRRERRSAVATLPQPPHLERPRKTPASDRTAGASLRAAASIPDARGGCTRRGAGDDAGAVMAARPRARATATTTTTAAPLLGPLLLLLAMLAAGSEACTVDECSQKYGEALSAAPGGGGSAQARLCAVLQRYRECVHGRAPACHGNLGYHSALTIVRRRMLVHGCAAATHHAATRRPPPPTPPPPGLLDDDDDDDSPDEEPGLVEPPEVSAAPPPVDAECDYRGPAEHVHCGLFGDPHLKTFSGQYQTCRVEGAWPLIDNAHLAVQVTNKPVLNGSRATATTKVTVIVRGAPAGSAACSRHRKTYEATADAPLPATFVDGTQRSAGGNVQLSVHEEGRRVELWVRHVDALVVVRRAGRYLAFSARLPRHVAFGGGGGGRPSSGLQLCARGCPSSELLHPLEDRGSAMKQADAEAVCGASNLTGSYHDWCVFDVMTTGADDFAAAAHAALTDVRRLDPLSAPSTSASSSSASGGAPRGGREQRSGAASLAAWLRAALAASVFFALAV
ncbi:repulsive guidance molecule B-like [Schistocerca serialis cubense]|uniref:repulsive guidance molecule B-like n=1 Tax=Schistocerca serialis cubense TaxID=2023355 RepID=UPI00214E70E0|nr:repulsive guidance molecule B-like [Schistocerca serialis cubense]